MLATMVKYIAIFLYEIKSSWILVKKGKPIVGSARQLNRSIYASSQYDFSIIAKAPNKSIYLFKKTS